MQLRIILGLCLCLIVQVVVLSDTAGVLTAVAGSIDDPHAVASLIFFATGVIESLLVLLFFVSERGGVLGAMAQHAGDFLRTLIKLVSPFPNHQGEALDEIQSERDRRHGIVRMGVIGAIKFFAIAVVFFIAAATLGIGTILSL